MTALSGEKLRWNSGASRLRILGSIAIVVLHTMSSAEIIFRDSISLQEGRVSLMIVYGLMWAVPVFVMVSGALLLDPAREMSLGRIFRSYVLRIFLALTIFVFIFRIFDMIMDGEQFGLSVFADALKRLVTGSSWSHMWYLYMLLGLYLLLPAYRMVAAGCDGRMFRYLTLVCFLFLSLMPMLELAGIHVGFHIQLSIVYTLYFFMGYGIASGKLPVSRMLASILFMAGTVIIFLFLLAWWRTGNTAFKDMLSSYASPGVVLQSVGIYAFWGTDREKDEGEHRMLRFADSTTFGVYLIHMIPLRLVLRYMKFDPYEKGAYSFVLLIFAVTVVSGLLTALLRRIPAVRKVL